MCEARVVIVYQTVAEAVGLAMRILILACFRNTCIAGKLVLVARAGCQTRQDNFV